MKNHLRVFSLFFLLVLFGCTSPDSSRTPSPIATMTPGLPTTGPNSPAATAIPLINPEVFTFISVGDKQSEAVNFTTKAGQIANLHPDLLIFNGDVLVDGQANIEINPMILSIKNAGLFTKTFFVHGNKGEELVGKDALWKGYFETAPNFAVLPPGAMNLGSLDPKAEPPSYSFVFGNSILIGLDIPGDTDFLDPDQLNFLESRLSYAEGNDLEHAFIFFQGPLACVESTACDCTTRISERCAPSELVSLLNKHPIVSATFHGNSHILEWTHMDEAKVEAPTATYGNPLSNPPGDWASVPDFLPTRTDYVYMDVGPSQGFATISINKASFSINYYKTGSSAPVWTRTFTKGAIDENNPADPNKRLLKYYLVDRVINPSDFATLAAWGINTAIVDFDVNGETSEWQSVFIEAAKYDIDIVIWPSDWKDRRPDCDWAAPFPVNAKGDITKVKPLLDVASQYPDFIGIVNGHEFRWTCENLSFDEMAGLKDQLKAYALTKGRKIKVWNFVASLYDESILPASQIPRIMDVAVIWKHCAGNTTERCAGSNSTMARIENARSRLAQIGLGGKVDLVFLVQTFTTDSPYNNKFTLAELESFSCEVLHTNAVDGFGYYTWNAGWWPDLHGWPDLQPAILTTHDTCVHSDPWGEQ